MSLNQLPPRKENPYLEGCGCLRLPQEVSWLLQPFGVTDGERGSLRRWMLPKNFANSSWPSASRWMVRSWIALEHLACTFSGFVLKLRKLGQLQVQISQLLDHCFSDLAFEPLVQEVQERTIQFKFMERSRF